MPGDFVSWHFSFQGKGIMRNNIEAFIESKYPGMAYDLFAQVSPEHDEDFARVEVDVTEGEDFFMIVRSEEHTSELSHSQQSRMPSSA